MPENGERIITGSTVEEKDQQGLEFARATLQSFLRERSGINPDDPIEIEILPPTRVVTTVEQDDQIQEYNPYTLPSDNPVRLTLVREQMSVALRSGVSKRELLELKNLLKAA